MNTFLTDAERLEAIAVGIQAYKNPNATFEAGKSTFSKNKAMEAMRAALIKSAGGDTNIDFKKMIRGQYYETFALIEEILKVDRDINGKMMCLSELVLDSFYNRDFIFYKNIFKRNNIK